MEKTTKDTIKWRNHQRHGASRQGKKRKGLNEPQTDSEGELEEESRSNEDTEDGILKRQQQQEVAVDFVDEDDDAEKLEEDSWTDGDTEYGILKLKRALHI